MQGMDIARPELKQRKRRRQIITALVIGSLSIAAVAALLMLDPASARVKRRTTRARIIGAECIP